MEKDRQQETRQRRDIILAELPPRGTLKLRKVCAHWINSKLADNKIRLLRFSDLGRGLKERATWRQEISLSSHPYHYLRTN